ncbi:MAG: hypothetical protein ACLQUY_21040 [Ktedonobacterales bacterium]
MVTLGETGSVQGILARSLLLAGPRRLEWAEQQLPDPAPTPAFHQKELHIFGSSDGWNYQEHAAWYFGYLLKTPTELAEVFQEEIAAEELPATFERLAQGDARPVKVLVRYGSSNQHLATTGS